MADKYMVLIILLCFGIIVYYINCKTTNNKLQKKEQIMLNDKPYKKSKIDVKQKEHIYVNSEFIEVQYNKDYNDTINAIDNLTSQKELFNFNFSPVVESSPDKKNVKQMVKWFIKKLNYEVKHNVEEYIHKNSGWTDMGKLPNIKSGSEKQLEYLGIPKLYNDSADKAFVKLISIDKAEQYTTDTQIRFIVYIIIQKENVHDQMILKVLFFMEREYDDVKTKDNFFKKDLDNNTDDHTLDIEQIFIVGYLTNAALRKTQSDNFNDYENLQDKEGITSQKQIIKTMIEKHKAREKEANDFLNTLDDETREIHNIPETKRCYTKNTRTVIDDLHQPPQNAFNDVNV